MTLSESITSAEDAIEVAQQRLQRLQDLAYIRDIRLNAVVAAASGRPDVTTEQRIEIVASSADRAADLLARREAGETLTADDQKWLDDVRAARMRLTAIAMRADELAVVDDFDALDLRSEAVWS